MKISSRNWPLLITLILLLCLFITWYPRHVSDNLLVNDDAEGYRLVAESISNRLKADGIIPLNLRN